MTCCLLLGLLCSTFLFSTDEFGKNWKVLSLSSQSSTYCGQPKYPSTFTGENKERILHVGDVHVEYWGKTTELQSPTRPSASIPTIWAALHWDRDPSINVAIGNGERDLVMRGPERRRRGLYLLLAITIWIAGLRPLFSCKLEASNVLRLKCWNVEMSSGRSSSGGSRKWPEIPDAFPLLGWLPRLVGGGCYH